MSDYNVGIQNWAIAQDERGVMYFGNNSGLLEFDGSAWRLYELPTKGIVRAIYISEDGKIYVGSYEEFGYFVHTPYNTLEYHSLKDEVKDFTFHNDEIWNIVCVQGEIVFQSFGSLFFYNGNSVEEPSAELISGWKYFLFSKNKWWTLCLFRQENGRTYSQKGIWE